MPGVLVVYPPARDAIIPNQSDKVSLTIVPWKTARVVTTQREALSSSPNSLCASGAFDPGP